LLHSTNFSQAEKFVNVLFGMNVKVLLF
jgi:hypothetical protein